MTGQIGLLTAFVAGMVSFLSPCVLPLIPGYLSFMTGLSLSEMSAKDRSTGEILAPILLFVAGFTVVFVALGASATVLGSFLNEYRSQLETVTGVILVALGLLMVGVVRIPAALSVSVDPARARSFGRGASFVLGLLFPFALGSCAGPVLGGILVMASRLSQVGSGVALLLAYAAGLAVPFILVGLLFGRLAGGLRALSKHAKTINRIAGGILIVMGVLVITGTLDTLAAWLNGLLPVGL